MLVDDPLDTLRTLCTLSNSLITWESFKSQYEAVKGRSRKPVDEKTVDTHFYFLKILGLVQPLETESGGRRIAILGKELCTFLDKPDMTKQFQELLATILLENPDKGQLFRRFLEFVKKPTKLSAIRTAFKTVPAKTLVPWSRLAGLVELQKGTVWALHRAPHKRPSALDFRKQLIQAYDEMKETDTFGIKRIFVNIDELRVYVCYKLGGLSIKEFDDYLTELLESTEGKDIKLHGAPSSVFAERQNFMYHDKLYAYLSVGV